MSEQFFGLVASISDNPGQGGNVPAVAKAWKPYELGRPTRQQLYDNFNDQTTTMSAKHREVINGALAPATRKKYGSSVAHFERFCEGKGIPRSDWYPASHDLVLDWVVSMDGLVGSKAASARVTALKNIHVKEGMVWAGDTRQMQMAKKGIANRAPDCTIDKRAPVTHGRMRSLDKRLSKSVGKDVAAGFDAVAAVVGMIRLGELVPDSANEGLFDPTRYPTGGRMLPPFSAAGSRNLDLPWTKVTGRKGAKVSLCKQDCAELDIVRWWALHEKVNKITKDVPLSSYLDESGRRRILTRTELMKRCNEVWAEEGLEPLTGHSFRIGGATHYLVNGVDPSVVKVLGRWKSNAFEEYWRNTEILAEIHVEKMVLRRAKKVVRFA